MSDADRMLSIPRAVGAWQQLAAALPLAAWALRSFPDRVPGIAGPREAVLIAEGELLLQLFHKVADIGGLSDSMYGLALRRSEWSTLDTALVRAASAVNANVWLFQSAEGEDRETHTRTLLALLAMRSEIRTALEHGGPTEDVSA